MSEKKDIKKVKSKHSSSKSHSRSHSHHSSNKRKKEYSGDYTRLRNIFAFLLFVFIFFASISGCFRYSIVSERRVSEVFTNREYVQELYSDVLRYSEDLCEHYNIPKESVQKVITYTAIDDIQKAYTEGTLSVNDEYSEDAYSDLITDLNEGVYSSVKSTLNVQNKKSSELDEYVHTFADIISDYVTEKVEFEYINAVKSVLNLGNTISVAVLVISAIIAVALALVVISLGEELYRNLRSVCHSVTAAAMLNFLLVVAYGIVRATKTLIIYPSYLCSSVMDYINDCAFSVFATSALLGLISVLLSAVVWELKAVNLDD